MSRTLTDQGRERIAEIAGRYGVSFDAALCLFSALLQSGGGMAQFNHPELGGGGQWMRGGMTMVGDMFNHGLKAKVDGLCLELGNLLPDSPQYQAGNFQMQSQGSAPQIQVQGGYPQTQSQGGFAPMQPQGGFAPMQPMGGFAPMPSQGNNSPMFTASNDEPPEFGQAAWRGGQNDMRYAYYPAARRLVLSIGGKASIYDTGDHQLQGVSQQQQNGGQTLAFTSQFGNVTLASLRLVKDAEPPRPASPPTAAAAPSTVGGLSIPSPADLAGSIWVYTSATGAVSPSLTFLDDGGISGGDRQKYWSVEGGALRLFSEDGRPLAKFDTAKGDDSGRVISMGLSTNPQETLTRPAAAAAPQPSSAQGNLALGIELTQGQWEFIGPGDAILGRLGLMADGSVQGGRPTEARWRSDGTSLSLLHGSGRPTARFETFHFSKGRWTLEGSFIGEDNTECQLRQI